MAERFNYDGLKEANVPVGELSPLVRRLPYFDNGLPNGLCKFPLG
jgi:hypothetical protein